MIPTNSPECVLTITRAEGDNERLSPRWNPTADDLLADDWAVCEREVWPYGRPKKGRVEISSVYEGNRDIPYAARERGTDIISERGEPRSTKRKYLFRFPGAIGSD
jgi:hypothetical protein